MTKLKIKKVEQALQKKLKRKILAFGIDTALRTGWCKAWVEGQYLTLEYGFIKLESKDKYYRYNQFIDIFNNLLQPEMTVIVEEAFYGRNVKSFQLLSRIGMIAYMAAYQKHCQGIEFVMATQARSRLGFRGNSKKGVIQEEFKSRLKLTLDDHDIVDAMILSLTALIE